MKKQVCVIYTGGTIGMMPTENGYAPNPKAFPEVMDHIHDVNLPDFPSYEIVSLPRLLDSSDITYKEWNAIGEIIYERYDDFDGFVVLHGTDTMAYTASAMSFMLEGLNKPVIFTGSQIPLCRVRSDGIDNLVTSMLVASAAHSATVITTLALKKATSFISALFSAYRKPKFSKGKRRTRGCPSMMLFPSFWQRIGHAA